MFKILLNVILALAALPAFADLNGAQIVSTLHSGDRAIVGFTNADHSVMNFADCDYRPNLYTNCKPVLKNFAGGFSTQNYALERLNITLPTEMLLASNLTQLGNLPEIQAKFADWKSDVGLQLRMYKSYMLDGKSARQAIATEVSRDLQSDALARIPQLSNVALQNLTQVSPQTFDAATDAELEPSLPGVDLDTVKEALNLSVDQLAGISQ